MSTRRPRRRVLKRGRGGADVVPNVITELQELREELRTLMGSYEYAFAMGHGCSIGDHPRFWEIRQRVADLRARIAELTE